jgi:tetratricopeptide (TPR) repeat protein
MRKQALFIFWIAILAFQSFAQEKSPVNIFDQFLSQISSKSTLEEIEKTIAKAENFYQGEKKNAGEDQRAQARLLSEFAAFRRSVERILTEKIRITKKDADFFKTLSQLVGMRQENFRKLEKTYREVIEIYQKNPSWEDLQIAEIKFELAALQSSYEPLIPDMSSPSKKRSLTWKEKRERLADTQQLFSHSLNIREKLLSENDDKTLLTELSLALSLIESGDFERALSLFEKYISGIETKYGKESKTLLPALKMSLAIFRMIGDENSVNKISQQILSITGKKEDTAETFLFITPRANSFSYDGITGKDGVEVAEVKNYTRINPEANSSVSPGIVGAGGTGNLTSIDKVTIPFFGNVRGLTKVVIAIDDKGKVIEAEAQTKDEKLKKKAEKEVLDWEFKPFNYKNEAKKMKGWVYYFKKNV